MFKLREISQRWLEARYLLLNGDTIIQEFSAVLETPSCSRHSGGDVPKRLRAMSDESIVDVKDDGSIRRDSDSSRSTTPDSEFISSNALPEASSTEWECKKCTFVNIIDHSSESSSCAICGWFKARSVEATTMRGIESIFPKRKSPKEYPVEDFIKTQWALTVSDVSAVQRLDDEVFSEILSRKPASVREHTLTGPSSTAGVLPTHSSSQCLVLCSKYNLVSCGQAQEESSWIDALERDLYATHNLDEELVFSKRFLSAKKNERADDEERLNDDAVFHKHVVDHYSTVCLSILGKAYGGCQTCAVPSRRLSFSDWVAAGVHSESYLRRLVGIHVNLVKESIAHYEPVKKALDNIPPEGDGSVASVVSALLTEPKCDLFLHCLSHVEGDNVMDRFMLPALFERADLIFDAISMVFENQLINGKSVSSCLVAARPPGHHCPSFEDRLIGLSASSGSGSADNLKNSDCSNISDLFPNSKLESQLCCANNLTKPPRELGMGFCSLNALSVAVKTFLKLRNPAFVAKYGRSIRIAIVDLDIHAGNGTELVFRDNRSVLHLSVHRYGWLKMANETGDDLVTERVLPGTHSYKDVGGMIGKKTGAKTPRGEGYAVNINLRKGDGNAEVLSSFAGIGIPILKQFSPDIVVIACGFDGLKLSTSFKQRWGEESCPGMDAEYTPSLYGYIAGLLRSEVQQRVVAVTEGGYDPLSVGLAARSLHKALKGEIPIAKPPIRVFNSDWLQHLNNMWTHQQKYWDCLRTH